MAWTAKGIRFDCHEIQEIMLASRGLGADSYAASCIVSASMFVKLASGFVGGAVVDGGNRRSLMIASGLCQVGIWLSFAAVDFLGLADVVIFGAFTLVSALVWGLLGGAADAALRGIAADGAEYVKAKTACEGRNSAIGLFCSPVGALLYGVSPAIVPLVQTSLFGISALFASALPCGDAARSLSGSGSASAENAMEMLGQGVSWIAHQRAILTLLAAASLINFSFQIWQYGLQYIQLDAGQTALGVSVLDMASCIGILVGAMMAMKMSGDPKPVKAVWAVLAALAIASTCLFLGIGSDLSAALALAVFSLPMPHASASIQGKIFLEVPDKMQGRARSVFNVVAQGFALVAPLAASFLSCHGAEPAICVALLAAMGLALLCSRADEWKARSSRSA